MRKRCKKSAKTLSEWEYTARANVEVFCLCVYSCCLFYKFSLFLFFAGPNVPRSTLHKTSSSESKLVIFLFDSFFLFVSLRNIVILLSPFSDTWYKELQMNKGLEEKMSELQSPKRRNFMIPAGKYRKSSPPPTSLHHNAPTPPFTPVDLNLGPQGNLRFQNGGRHFESGEGHSDEGARGVPGVPVTPRPPPPL